MNNSKPRAASFIVVVIVLSMTVGCQGFYPSMLGTFNSRHHHEGNRLPRGGPSYTYQTEYFTQKVDHFSFDNDDEYKQRYLIANQYWNKDGGPIFFYTGNEGDIELFCENTGFIWDIAPEFKALIIFAEHRYYGKSLPYGSSSYANASTLDYLTSEQALADFGELIRNLKQTIPGAAKSQVIAFGGSYGGMLSAWMRIKYPHLVQGALASSAPIWAFSGLSNCGDFYSIVGKVFNMSDPHRQCAQNIRTSWYTVESTGSGMAGGLQLISSTFKLCKPVTDKYALGSFMSFLADTYVNFAMVDYPYPANFLADLPAWPVKAACQFLSNPLKGKDLLDALSQVTNLYYNYTGTVKCIDWNGENGGALGYEGWSYQACTEMVMPMCSNNSGMFYNMPWNFQAYSDGCFNAYGVRPRDNWISLQYWGKDLSAASNIIFSNGLLDPWSSGGVLKTVSETVVAIQIEDGAHHYDLRAKNDKDTPAVKAARQQEFNIINSWLGLTP